MNINLAESVKDKSELIDVLDEDGNFTGRVETRDKVHQEGLWHREVAAWIGNDKMQVLLQKRAKNKKFNPGRWAVCAGHIESGEQGIEAVIKEIEQEIGVSVAKEHFNFMLTLKKLDNSEYSEKLRYSFDLINENKSGYTNEKGHINKRISEVYFLFLTLPAEKLTRQKEEVDELRWFDFYEAKQKILNGDESFAIKNSKNTQIILDKVEQYLLKNKR